MAGLVPAFHVFDAIRKQDVDARDKPGHDGVKWIQVYPHHCERSEAIHAATQGRMDCFVATLLAMTRRGHCEKATAPDTPSAHPD